VKKTAYAVCGAVMIVVVTLTRSLGEGGAEPGVPHSVKLIEGKPVPIHVERFVATAAEVV